MAAPTQISGSPWQSAWNANTHPKLAPTASSFAVGVGDLIVVEVEGEDTAVVPSTPTNAATGPATITWTSLQSIGTASFTRAAAWKGVVTAAGNVQVSVQNTGSFLDYGIIVWAYPASGHGGVGQSAGGTGNGTAPSLAPGAAWSANSAVLCVVGDWNAASFGATRSYRTNLGAATERNYAAVDSNYTTAAWEHADAGASPGSGAVGLTTPTMKWSLVAVEVLAPAGGGTTFTQTVSASCASTAVVVRQGQLIRAAAAAASAVAVRQSARILSAVSAASATVVRQPSRILVASSACTATAASLKARFLTLTASAASTASRLAQAQRIVSASSASTGVLVRRPQRTLAASSASTATTATLKVLLLTVSASAACSAAASRIASHVLSLAATVAATAVLARDVRLTRLTTVGDSASVVAVGPGGGPAGPPGQRPTLGVG